MFELQILEFSNFRMRLASGACCGGECGAPCETAFTLCLKEYQATATAGGCSFGSVSSGALGRDSFTLPDTAPPLRLPFTFRWTRSFALILRAHEPAGELIEEAWWSGIVEPGDEWHTLRHAGAAASLTYRVRVLCQTNYYNATCTTFCRARDDKFGHYTCRAPTGDKLCLPGWRGPNCEIRESITLLIS